MQNSNYSYLTRPLTGGAPSLIVIFSLGLTIAEQAGLLGLALGLILTSWFWKYAFILFDYTVRGVSEPPALDIQMVNPADEQRPLALLFILCVIYAVCHALSLGAGSRMGWIAASICVLCLPAIIAVLALESNILPALNPVAWYRLIADLGLTYVHVLVASTVYALLLKWVWMSSLWRPLQLAVSLFCSLSIFGLLAGIVYERRDQIGVEVWHSPERTKARDEADDLKQSAKVIDEAYGQMRSGKHVSAWKIITDWLDSRGHRPQDYDWLCGKVESWADDRYRIRLTEEYLEKLLAAGSTSQALTVLEHTLRWNKNFRPKSPEATLRLAHVAVAGGAPRLGRMLTQDFAARFPQDANIRAAESLLARLEAQGNRAP